MKLPSMDAIMEAFFLPPEMGELGKTENIEFDKSKKRTVKCCHCGKDIEFEYERVSVSYGKITYSVHMKCYYKMVKEDKTTKQK